jgi:hypothetical protein
MLAMLRVQSNPAARRNSSSSSSSISAAEQWQRMQNVIACTFNIAQVITAGPYTHAVVRSKPHVQQVLASGELRQLLVAAAAWIVGLLHQQQQGRAAVDAAAVVRCLSNSSAAATYATGTSSQDSSSSNVVLPRHLKVLHVLGVSALLANPSDSSSPASTQQAKDFGNNILRGMNPLLHALLEATAMSLECSSDSSTIADTRTSAVSWRPVDAYNSSSSSSSSSAAFSTWQRVVPELVRMLVELVQLGLPAEACEAAMTTVMQLSAQHHHAGVWQQPAGSAALSELVVQLGLPVLHAVQQQQQQQQTQQQSKHLAYALWSWAAAVFNAAGVGGCSLQHWLHGADVRHCSC